MQSFVDRRFKPSGPVHLDPHQELHSVEQRLEQLEQRLSYMESAGKADPPDDQD